ncbi:hypothetical protein LCGC14_1280030 [marine sediment metagenome]|uniref:Uncharacterized protein n=1 Tax=marine sediment metagenome TaxID=412755 RepID=A0A0F9KVI6_9ZZZZ
MTKVIEMTPEEFNTAVQAKVDEALSSKEEAHARQEAEDALTEAKATFEKLRAALEAKDAKIAEYEEALAKLDTNAPSEAEVAANERTVELEATIETLSRRAEVAEAALETLAREETAAGRMSDLEDAGIALEGDEAERQYAKVRGFDDESFEAYKSELVALKSKYASSSEEEGEDSEVELAEQEVAAIAESLGCDPQDEKCVSLVRDVASKMAQVTRDRRSTPAAEEAAEEEVVEGTESSEEAAAKPHKETASTKLSLGDAISKAMDQEIQAPPGLKAELAQAWEERYAEKHGENKS